MTRKEQIAAALELLGDPARRKDVEAALGSMESATRAAEHARVTKKARRAYSNALRRMRDASAAMRAAGGALALRQDVLDRAVAFDAKWQRGWTPPSPHIRQQTALALADHLLSPCERVISRQSLWHQLAAVLLGDRDADLYRQLRRYARFQYSRPRI